MHSAAPYLLITTVAACSLADLGGLASGAPETPADSGVEDSTASRDGSPDGNASAPDGNADATLGDCANGTVLAGIAALAGSVTAVGSAGSAYAHGYAAQSTGTARCLSIYLDAGPPQQLTVGVWRDQAQLPEALLASAEILNPKAGWNTVVLNDPVSVTGGVMLWIGLRSTGGDAKLRVRGGCTGPERVAVDCCIEALDNPYVVDSRENTCDLRAFLSP